MQRTISLGLILAAVAASMFFPTTRRAYAAVGLTWPFEQGTTWVICKGYHQGYSFDLVVNSPAAEPCDGGYGSGNPTQGKRVLAAASGTVDSATRWGTNPVVCVNIEGSTRSFIVGHVDHRIAPGTRVVKGVTVLGNVQPPLQGEVLPGNNKTSHIHFGLYSQRGCVNSSNRPLDADLPFCASSGGLNIDGVCFPGTRNGLQHRGKEVKRTDIASRNGDYNRDRKGDVAFMYDYGNEAARIHLFLSTGSRFNYQGSSGCWAVTRGYDLNRVVHAIPGDFNGDGRGDIAALYDYGNGASRIHVWLSDGSRCVYQGSSGWWAVASGYTATRVKHAVPGDFNRDGRGDIAFMYDYGNGAARIHLFLSNGSRFNYQGSRGCWAVASGYNLARVVHAIPGDFNGDGRGDIAALYDYGNGASRIHVWLSGSVCVYQGSSGWWRVDSGYTATRVKHAVPLDFNRDGRDDIAFMYDYGNEAARIHLLLSNGSRFNYQGSSGCWAVASGYDLNRVVHAMSGDFNSDGRGDIAALYDYGNGASRIHVWLSDGTRCVYQGSSGWWRVDSGYTATRVKHALP